MTMPKRKSMNDWGDYLLGYVWPVLLSGVVLMAFVEEHGVPKTVGDWIGFAILALFMLALTFTLWYLTWTSSEPTSETC